MASDYRRSRLPASAFCQPFGLEQKTAAAEFRLTRLLAWLEPELIGGQDARDIAAVIEAAEAWLALLNARKRLGSGKA